MVYNIVFIITCYRHIIYILDGLDGLRAGGVLEALIPDSLPWVSWWNMVKPLGAATRITDPSLVQSSAKREARHFQSTVWIGFRLSTIFCRWDWTTNYEGGCSLVWPHEQMISNDHRWTSDHLSKDIERFPKPMIMISGCSRTHSNTRSFDNVGGNTQEAYANSVLESVKDFIRTNKCMNSDLFPQSFRNSL